MIEKNNSEVYPALSPLARVSESVARWVGSREVMIAGFCAIVAFNGFNYLHSVWPGVPHHVVRRLGVTVIADYWTTNRIEVHPIYVRGVGVDSKDGFIYRQETNYLW